MSELRIECLNRSHIHQSSQQHATIQHLEKNLPITPGYSLYVETLIEDRLTASCHIQTTWWFRKTLMQGL